MSATAELLSELRRLNANFERVFPTAAEPQTLTCAQAARKLGVKPSTMSAYACRYGGLKLANNSYSAAKIAELKSRRAK